MADTATIQAQKEFKRAFLSDDFFSEAIVYTRGATAKTMRAIVNRDVGLQQIGYASGRGIEGPVVHSVEIRISTSDTDGMTAIQTKTDFVTFAKTIGSQSTVKMQVMAVLQQDLGSWRLGLSG
jgi:hypothetical protein